jgi:NADH:ubiquinone oxidoreductase subunit F (NADH-binding)
MTSVLTASSLPEEAGSIRLLPAGGAAYRGHLERYGPVPHLNARPLLAEVERSGLTGRGGAGYPTWIKLRSVGTSRTIVVANGTEGEPTSQKDKALMRGNPHLVLDGLLAAAQAVNADEAVIAVSRADGPSRQALTVALAERPRVSRLIKLVAAPERFVTGEESALVNWLNGGPAKPTVTPPRPFERGVQGRPTLVQNVETLANIALIARYGAAWFRQLGTASESGSVLATVLGAVRRPGVVEVPLGTPFSELLARCGGLTTSVQALLVGGYFGTFVPASCLGLTLSDEALRTQGATLGARALAVIPGEVCGVAESARVIRYLAGESAGQCGPCLFGLDALARAVEAIADCDPSASAAYARLARLETQIEGRGACAHPDGAVRLLASSLRVFREEFAAHLRGHCTAASSEPVLPIPAKRDDWR